MARAKPPSEPERRRLVAQVNAIRETYRVSAGEACRRCGVAESNYRKWAREFAPHCGRRFGTGSEFGRGDPGPGTGTGPPRSPDDPPDEVEDEESDQADGNELESGIRRALRRFAIDHVDWLDDEAEPEPEPVEVPEPEPEPGPGLVLVAVGADEAMGGLSDE